MYLCICVCGIRRLKLDKKGNRVALKPENGVDGASVRSASDGDAQSELSAQSTPSPLSNRSLFAVLPWSRAGFFFIFSNIQERSDGMTWFSTSQGSGASPWVGVCSKDSDTAAVFPHRYWTCLLMVGWFCLNVRVWSRPPLHKKCLETTWVPKRNLTWIMRLIYASQMPPDIHAHF